MKTILFAALAAVPAALSAQPAQQLDRGPLPGFVLGFEADDGSSQMQEYVPAGETVHDWTRMVTVHRMPGLAAQGITAPGFLGHLQGQLPQVCEGARVTGQRQFDIGGAGAAAMRSDCPSNPMTGSPEITFFRAITGAQDLFIVQAAFRYVPDAEDVAWAERYLATVHLCEGECP
ncbi:hypothetical protein [Parasphingopyxis marina]|uniref:Uncharacterized protein n=1 Tax=Parasphingopyxis marina TaxID=2761622 RepID=A0A842HYY4_9SPHN|nr:hypothetical protein [Parasphingopyxis marina]MBC2778142.1 hypothetical protein [Parasphingopyxis marina]